MSSALLHEGQRYRGRAEQETATPDLPRTTRPRWNGGGIRTLHQNLSQQLLSSTRSRISPQRQREGLTSARYSTQNFRSSEGPSGTNSKTCIRTGYCLSSLLKHSLTQGAVWCFLETEMQAQETGKSLGQMPLSDQQVGTQPEGLCLQVSLTGGTLGSHPHEAGKEPALGIQQPGSGSSHPSQEASPFPHRWEGGSPDKKSVMFKDPIISKLLPALCVAEGGNKGSWFLLFKTHWDVSLAFQSRP